VVTETLSLTSLSPYARRSGRLYTWGLGVSGNLGHGDRASLSQPRLVEALAGEEVVGVHCTVGQITPPARAEGLRPVSPPPRGALALCLCEMDGVKP
jgi:hypothetical protein